MNVLYELTQHIFFEKTRFKMGDTMKQFLTFPIEKKKYPELVEAQQVILGGISSEKTSSYVRLSKKNPGTGKFVQVKQK